MRAERKAGVLLGEMEGKGSHGGDRKSTAIMSVETLEDMGISDKQSSRWQLEAGVPEEQFEQDVQGIRYERIMRRERMHEPGFHGLAASDRAAGPQDLRGAVAQAQSPERRFRPVRGIRIPKAGRDRQACGEERRYPLCLWPGTPARAKALYGMCRTEGTGAQEASLPRTKESSRDARRARSCAAMQGLRGRARSRPYILPEVCREPQKAVEPGTPKAALRQKAKKCRSKLTFLCSENCPSWPRKPRKNLASLARRYHRPGKAGFTRKDTAKASAISVGAGDSA